ncbi:unnamed protein product, partial [Rotaria magnacalcarata]
MAQKIQREYQRAQCVALSNAGLSCREASKIIGISKSSVQRAIKRFEETGAFHDRNVRMLKRLTENDGRYSSREITNKLNNSLKNPVCKATVINYLRRSGYECKTKIKKPFLTIKHKKERLNWCLAHFNWTINDWERVIFSDETTFYVIKHKNKVKIWRTKDEQSKEGCMEVAAIGGGGGRVNFWDAIRSEGTGCFRIYSENTNSNVYCDILDNYLIPTHDNARYHVSRQIQTKLHESGVKLLEWSAKSPDLNVIEHLWSIIDDKLKSKSISSVKELTEALSTEWLSIKPELC